MSECGGLGVWRLTHGVLVEPDRMRPRLQLTAARVLVRPLHRAQLLLDRDLLPCFEQQYLHPLRRQDVRGHAARRAGADDYGVVGAGEVDFLLRRRLDSQKGHGIRSSKATSGPRAVRSGT